MSKKNRTPKKRVWSWIKGKVDSGTDLDYDDMGNYYHVYIIEGNTKFFVNLFDPAKINSVIGVEESNPDDYNEFIASYKDPIDDTPPHFPDEVDLYGVMKTGSKIQIHESSRPDNSEKEYTTIWAGSSDDSVNHIQSAGNQLLMDVSAAVSSVTVDCTFDPVLGEVWLHEGYSMWEGAGWGDTLTVSIYAPASQLQESVDLDFVLDDDRVKVAVSGPGTGTHGWAATPVPVPNYYNEGHWNYDATNGLTANVSAEGSFDIWQVDRAVKTFINRIPIYGTSYGYTMLQSADSALVPAPYFVRLYAKNNSGTAWKIAFFVTVYREFAQDKV